MSEYSKEFPEEIDLGREVPDYGECCPTPVAEEKEKKTKIVYPCLYASGVEALVSIPKEGYALIKYKRIGMNTRENRDGDEDVSCELEISKICLPESGGRESLMEELADFIKSRETELDGDEDDGEEEGY